MTDFAGLLDLRERIGSICPTRIIVDIDTFLGNRAVFEALAMTMPALTSYRAAGSRGFVVPTFTRSTEFVVFSTRHDAGAQELAYQLDNNLRVTYEIDSSIDDYIMRIGKTDSFVIPERTFLVGIPRRPGINQCMHRMTFVNMEDFARDVDILIEINARIADQTRAYAR